MDKEHRDLVEDFCSQLREGDRKGNNTNQLSKRVITVSGILKRFQDPRFDNLLDTRWYVDRREFQEGEKNVSYDIERVYECFIVKT